MKAIVNTYLNKRTGLPSVNALTEGYYKPNQKIEIIEIVNGDPYEGNKVWYKLDDDNYVWSGGVEGVQTILPESNQEIFVEKNNYWISDYGISELWDNGLTGKGVKVAMLDSGLSLPHKDLIINEDLCIDHSHSIIKGLHDKTGHGTHCAGIIKASNNGFGIKGIAYNCDFYFAKIRNDVLGDDFEYLKKGIQWAIEKKVDIISISQGRYRDGASLHPVIKRANENNIIVVCAGGKVIDTVTEPEDILYPAKYKECISVGSVDQNKRVTIGTLASKSLSIGAPGTNIKSTFLNNKYEILSGTSQAAPFVCGVLALMIQYCKENTIDYSSDLFKSWLKQTSEEIDIPFPIIQPMALFFLLKNL